MPADTTESIQLSLCVPFFQDSASIPDFVADVTSFFAEFPITYELLLAAPRSKSRAKNLVELFSKARGEYLIAMDADLSIPLSECFKILQIFFGAENTEVVFGDRTQKKKKLENTSYQTVLSGTETFFHGIIREKTSWAYQDPFCPVFAMRKSTFDKLKSEITARGWHLTPEIQRLAQKANLPTQEIPLYAGSRKSSKTPPVTEILGLLNFVLFRI